MATFRLLREGKNDDGKWCYIYEMRAARKRGVTAPTTRYYAPVEWSKKYREDQMAKAGAKFDMQCKEGEIVTKAERKRQEQARLEAEAKIQTVNKYAAEFYLPTKVEECKENTQAFYEQFLRNFICPAIGDKRITSVSVTDLQKIILKAQQDGYKFATLKGLYKTMRQIFKMAYDADVIDRNPMDKVKPPKRRKDEAQKSKVPFTSEEVAQIREYLNREPLQWRALFNVIIDCGIRRGEACAIKWRNVDMQTGRIFIDGGICTTTGGRWYETTTKSGKPRHVIVSRNTLDLLTALKATQNKAGYVSPYVFLKRGTAEPLRPDSVTAYGRKFEKKYGIEKRSNPHNFRHTWATICTAKGASPADVSKALGHAEISTTMNMYVHPDEEAGIRAGMIFLESAIGE